MKFIKKIVKHPLFSGSFIMVGGSLCVNAINYFYHLVMGRILGPASYGELMSLYAILYMVGIVPISASFAIVKEISTAKTISERTTVYYSIKKFLWRMAILLSLVLIMLTPFIGKFLHISNLPSIIIVGFILFFSLITLVNQATLQGSLNFFGVIAPSFLSGSLKFALGIILILLGFSVFGAMFAILVAAIASYLLSLQMVKKVITNKVSKKKFIIKPFLIYALPVLLQALAFTSLFTVDVILVKHFFTAREAGLYAALSTLGKIIYFAAQPITAVMFPVISGKRSNNEKYKQIFYLSFVLTLLISLGVVFLFYLLPNIAIGVLYGKEYLSVKSELVWMGLFMVVYTLCNLIVNFLLSINRVKIVLLPLMASIVQAVAIWIYHDSLMQVIQISLTIMIMLLSSLVLYLLNYQYKLIYAKN